jgi:hypothetical protein
MLEVKDTGILDKIGYSLPKNLPSTRILYDGIRRPCINIGADVAIDLPD